VYIIWISYTIIDAKLVKHIVFSLSARFGFGCSVAVVDGQTATGAITARFQWQLLLVSATTLSFVDNCVHLFNDGPNLLSHSSVRLNDFAHLLDHGFDHFMDHTVGLVLEGGVLYLCGCAGSVALLHIDATGAGPEVHLYGHVIRVHFDDLGLGVVVLVGGQWSQLNGSAGLNGRVIGRRAVTLLSVLEGSGR